MHTRNYVRSYIILNSKQSLTDDQQAVKYMLSM